MNRNLVAPPNIVRPWVVWDEGRVLRHFWTLAGANRWALRRRVGQARWVGARSAPAVSIAVGAAIGVSAGSALVRVLF